MAQVLAAGLVPQVPGCVAVFAEQAVLRRRESHMPVRMAAANAPMVNGIPAGPALNVPQVMKPAPANDKPPSTGIASGMAQHAAHAPATPTTANKGFFILLFHREVRGNSRMLTLESQAA
jgi:hypothetical protein